MILDEPTADLDPASVAVVAERGPAAARGPDDAPDRAPSRARPARRPRGRARRAGAASPRPTGGRRERDAAPRCCGSAHAPRPRLALAAVLGALTVVFGVGLMATAGYLISRAAERPPILSLMVAIVAVRVLRPRPAGRPLPRAARLPRPRAARRSAGCATHVLRAHRAARAGAARLLPRGRPALAHGRRRRRAAEPVSARARPPLVALLAGAVVGGRRRRRSARRGARARGRACSSAGSRCPRCRGCARRARRAPAGRRRAASSSAELVELIARRARARRVRRRAGRARPRPRRRRARSSSSPGATRSPPASATAWGWS